MSSANHSKCLFTQTTPEVVATKSFSLRASSPFGGVVRSHTRPAHERRRKVNGELASRLKHLVATTSGVV